MNKNFTTPVLFLIYNRPDITKKVFEKIKEIKPTKLFIAADGPKSENSEDINKCQESRQILNQIDWKCELKTLLRDTNLGCKNAVSSSISWFFTNVDEGIILEDDCLPNLDFFWFCQAMLIKYKADQRIMMINGMNYLFNKVDLNETYFFSKYFAVWGWATWKRAWDKYEQNFLNWSKYREKSYLVKMLGDSNIANYLTKMFDEVALSKIDTWDAQWVYTCLFNNALAITPKFNLISNIGLSGTHTTDTASRSHFMPTKSINIDHIIHPVHMISNYELDKITFDFITEQKGKNSVPIKTYFKILKKFIPEKKAKEIEAKNLKPNPKDYSTILGKGSIVPCQIESYFLAMNKYVSKTDSVLDVGFGLGYGLNIMAIKADKVYGIDVDKIVYEYCLNTVVGRNPKLKKIDIYDGYNIAYPDEFFDIVTCNDVIEHVEDYNRLIKEMLRVSKKGVFFSTPNRRPEYTNPDGTPQNYWHLREWSYQEFDEILRKFGKVEWNFLNGTWDGPFTYSREPMENTLTLTPFLLK